MPVMVQRLPRRRVPQGKFDPTATAIPSGATNFIRVPLNPENPVDQLPTISGVIQSLPKGYWQFRTTYTVSYFRSDLRHRIVIPAGALDHYVGPGSSGAVDASMYFSTLNDATVELQFARTSTAGRTVDSTFDFELILLSTTKFPAWLAKSGTQLLGATANVFEKINGWTIPAAYSATTNGTGDEIVVPESGQYLLEWQATFSTANTANAARVTDQFGTVLATKTSPQTLGSATVALNKGDSIKLEAMAQNSSTTARRTITEAGTLLRITPIL